MDIGLQFQWTNFLKVFTELVIEDGVGHVLQHHSSVAKKTTLRIMLRIVPDKGRERGRGMLIMMS